MRFLQRKLLIVLKGITLLETMLSLGLIAIIISITLPIMLRLAYLYKKQIEVDRSYYYAQEALMYIQNEISQNSLNAVVNIDTIKINKIDGTFKNIYFSNNGSILVDYYSNGKNIATNVILRNIKDFKVTAKSNIVYLYIITLEDRKIERCLRLGI